VRDPEKAKNAVFSSVFSRSGGLHSLKTKYVGAKKLLRNNVSREAHSQRPSPGRRVGETISYVNSRMIYAHLRRKITQRQ